MLFAKPPARAAFAFRVARASPARPRRPLRNRVKPAAATASSATGWSARLFFLGRGIATTVELSLAPLLAIPIGRHDAVREGVRPALEAVGIAARAILDDGLGRARASTQSEHESRCSKYPHGTSIVERMANLGPSFASDAHRPPACRLVSACSAPAPGKTRPLATLSQASLLIGCSTRYLLEQRCFGLACAARVSRHRSRSAFFGESRGWEGASQDERSRATLVEAARRDRLVALSQQENRSGAWIDRPAWKLRCRRLLAACALPTLFSGIGYLHPVALKAAKHGLAALSVATATGDEVAGRRRF